MAEKLDRELDTEAEFKTGDADDPDRETDAEALGARHRRRFGYTSAGAQENDADIADQGRKPLKVSFRKADVPESRIASFAHGMATHHITTVKKR